MIRLGRQNPLHLGRVGLDEAALANQSLALAGIIVGLLLCEAGLRCLGIGYPDFSDYDPQLGAKLRPGLKG